MYSLDRSDVALLINCALLKPRGGKIMHDGDSGGEGILIWKITLHHAVCEYIYAEKKINW